MKPTPMPRPLPTSSTPPSTSLQRPTIADRSLATVRCFSPSRWVGRCSWRVSRRRQGDRDRQGAGDDARTAPDPAAMLRRPRCRGRGLRVELCRADDHHPRSPRRRARTTASGSSTTCSPSASSIKRLKRCRRRSPIRRVAPVLLIDELDRADEAFEAFPLEVLADFQVTIPELGTVKAAHPPIVVITSNRTREASRRAQAPLLLPRSGIRRRARLQDRARQGAGHRQGLSEQVVHFVQALRKEDLFKAPGVAETLDWAAAPPSSTWWRSTPRRPRHARSAAQVPGRHRPHRRRQGEAADRRGARRAARGGVMRRDRQ